MWHLLMRLMFIPSLIFLWPWSHYISRKRIASSQSCTSHRSWRLLWMADITLTRCSGWLCYWYVLMDPNTLQIRVSAMPRIPNSLSCLAVGITSVRCQYIEKLCCIPPPSMIYNTTRYDRWYIPKVYPWSDQHLPARSRIPEQCIPVLCGIQLNMHWTAVCSGAGRASSKWSPTFGR